MDINVIRKAVSAGIAQMDATNLRSVVIEAQARINTLEAPLRAAAPVSSSGRPGREAFRNGDLVEFYDKRRQRIRGNIIGFNPRTIAVLEIEPTPMRKWRVDPGLLRLVGSDKVKVPEIKPVTPPSGVSSVPLVSGALPSAAGSGSW
jgi:hypothetical protein